MTADLADERRVDVLERWATSEDPGRLRGPGRDDADVQEVEVADA